MTASIVALSDAVRRRDYTAIRDVTRYGAAWLSVNAVFGILLVQGRFISTPPSRWPVPALALVGAGGALISLWAVWLWILTGRQLLTIVPVAMLLGAIVTIAGTVFTIVSAWTAYRAMGGV